MDKRSRLNNIVMKMFKRRKISVANKNGTQGIVVGGIMTLIFNILFFILIGNSAIIISPLITTLGGVLTYLLCLEKVEE